MKVTRILAAGSALVCLVATQAMAGSVVVTPTESSDNTGIFIVLGMIAILAFISGNGAAGSAKAPAPTDQSGDDDNVIMKF
jgi:hypothetical protein